MNLSDSNGSPLSVTTQQSSTQQSSTQPKDVQPKDVRTSEATAKQTAFESLFAFHPKIRRNLRQLGFSEPTPIQEQAIPAALAGRDLIGLAQTGTGKTAAFLLPILERMLANPSRELTALILVPTRELAEQVRQVAHDLSRDTAIRAITLYGGVSMQPQIANLRRGVNLVVACPGRLLDHIQRRTIKLNAVQVLVLDEADQMFDMGFLPNVREIIRHLPQIRQSMLFSATMPPDIRRLASDLLNDPVTVQVKFAAPIETVSHALYPVRQEQKTALLVELLRRTSYQSALVFTRTKHRAKRVAKQLEGKGFRTASLQGNLSQSKRRVAIDGFRSGKFEVLVATDIAARGIDIATVSHVINYDLPETADIYTHRIGRTGRASRTGDAFSFITPEDNHTVRQIERRLGSRIKQERLADFDYAAKDLSDSVQFQDDLQERRTPRRDNDRGQANRGRRHGRRFNANRKRNSAQGNSNFKERFGQDRKHPSPQLPLNNN